MWSKLKNRWGIANNFQVVIILVIFAVTGFSTLYVHRLINTYIGVSDETSFFIKLLIFIILILPIYTVLLYVWAVLLGQRDFFTKFIKMKIRLLIKRKA